MAPRVIRQRVTRVERLAFGPEPVGAERQAALDLAVEAGLAGHAGSVRWGAPSMGVNRFDGPAVTMQDLRGQALIGSAGADSIRTGIGTALPNSSAPPGLPATMQSLLGRYGW